MSKVIPKNAAAIIVTEDHETGFVDIQVVYPEGAIAGDRRVAIVDLAEQLLETALFGEDYEDGESE